MEAHSAPMALPLPVDAVMLPDPSHLAPHRIKRCTFRRMIRVEPKGERRYDVECLYPDRKLAIPALLDDRLHGLRRFVLQRAAWSDNGDLHRHSLFVLRAVAQ